MEAEHKQEEGAQHETHASGASQQSAQEDLKKVADRAKAATQGFSFAHMFEGRLDERNYLYIAVTSLVISYVLRVIPIIGWLVSLALLIIGLGVTARRLHDINMDSWLAVILLIPYVDIFFVIYLSWKQGDPKPNRFGNPPDKKRDMFKATLNT